MSQSLVLAVSLHFIEGTSSKEYHALLADRFVATRYGRRHTPSQGGVESFEAPDKAAAKYWNTLRNKTGKGYAVVDALTMPAGFLLPSAASGFTPRGAEEAIARWINVSEHRLRTGQAARQPMPSYANRVPTARTGKQGRNVIQTLTDTHANEAALFEAALAVPEERFLWNLALTHPNCPDEAKVARALMVTT